MTYYKDMNHGNGQQNSVTNVSGAKITSTKEKNSTTTRKVNETEDWKESSNCQSPTSESSDASHTTSIPDRNDDRLIDELSRRNETRDAFMDRF